MGKKNKSLWIKRVAYSIRRQQRHNQLSDKIAKFLLSCFGWVSLIIFIAIFCFLLKNSFSFLFSDVARKTIFSLSWNPTSFVSPSYGIVSMLLSTFLITIGSILWAGPVGILTSIFISQYLSKRERLVIRSMVEVFSSIPSVIIGMIGMTIVAPLLYNLFNFTSPFNGYVASLLVGIMALPTVISISLDALEDAPKSLKIASLGLGASKWDTIFKVIVPWAKPRIVTAVMLGIGRAVGETMIVLMVAGNSVGFPSGWYSSPLRTLTSTIAIEMGEVSSYSLHYSALFTLGLILFIFTMFINYVIDKVTRKKDI